MHGHIYISLMFTNQIVRSTHHHKIKTKRFGAICLAYITELTVRTSLGRDGGQTE